jgi:hypothetical protein
MPVRVVLPLLSYSLLIDSFSLEPESFSFNSYLLHSENLSRGKTVLSVLSIV